MSVALFRIGELSRRTGISADVIRKWERRYGLLSPARSDGNFRLYTSDDVTQLRLMRHYLSRRISPSRAAELVRLAHTAAIGRNPGMPSADAREARRALAGPLDRFDDVPAEHLLRRLRGVFPAGTVVRDVVLPYLRDLGERWECGEATVAQEHFASTFLEGWLLGLARGAAAAGARRALLAALPGEHHALGLLAFAVVLRDLGWRVTYFGADVPLGAVEQAAVTLGPEAIVLATVFGDVFAAAAADVVRLSATWPVVVGGA